MACLREGGRSLTIYKQHYESMPDFLGMRGEDDESSSDDDYAGLDPMTLVEKLREQRQQIAMAERSRREAEARFTPVAITPDMLSKTIAESIRQAGRLTNRNIVRMPIPGTPGAPETFKGTSGKLLPEFFKRFERCLSEAEIEDEGEILSHMIKYVGPSVGEWIQNHRTYKHDDYTGLKAAILKLYNNPELGDPKTCSASGL